MPSYIFTATISTEAADETLAFQELQKALDRNKAEDIFDIIVDSKFDSSHCSECKYKIDPKKQFAGHDQNCTKKVPF